MNEKTLSILTSLHSAGQAVIDDNSGDYETPTRSGCYVISMDKLATLRKALIDAQYHLITVAASEFSKHLKNQ